MKKKAFAKLTTLIVAVILLVGMTACGKSIGTGPETLPSIPETTVQTTTEPKETTTKETTTETVSEVSSDQITTQAVVDNNGGYVDPGYYGGGTEPQGQPQTEAPTEAPTQPPTEAPTQPPVQTWTVSISIDAGVYGGYFGGGTFTYYYPPTAYDALVSTGVGYTGDSNYIRSINGVGEFDHGPMSGWLYAVNGVTPGVGCGSYYLNDGDSVYWFYQGDE